MKKSVFLLLVTLILIVLLGACTYTPVNEDGETLESELGSIFRIDKFEDRTSMDADFYELTHKATGCKYIYNNGYNSEQLIKVDPNCGASPLKIKE